MYLLCLRVQNIFWAVLFSRQALTKKLVRSKITYHQLCPFVVSQLSKEYCTWFSCSLCRQTERYLNLSFFTQKIHMEVANPLMKFLCSLHVTILWTRMHFGGMRAARLLTVCIARGGGVSQHALGRGCVYPSRHWAGGMSAQGGVCLGVVSAQGGWGVWITACTGQGGCLPMGAVYAWEQNDPWNRMNDRQV